MELKYFSTFSGIGGFELGIQQAYESIISSNRKQQKDSKISSTKQSIINQSKQPDKSEKRWDNTCIGYSEIDKYATQIYKKHFPGHKNYGDITTINVSELPDFDLLVGGFPCQSFSIAGKRKGFEDTRGTLFFDLARILQAKQPELFIFENVKGLLSHDNGQTFKTIITTLIKLGYDLQWQVLNSKNFGVPQNRERVFIVGHLGGEDRRQVFPIGEGNAIHNGQGNEGLSKSLTATSYKGVGNDGTTLVEITKEQSQGYRVYDPKEISTTIAGEAGGVGAKTGLYALDLYNNKAHSDRTPALTEPHHNSLRLLQGSKIRRLTPIECERLQGFPDGWTEGISDSQRYKCLGNAVTVNVISEIIKNILYE